MTARATTARLRSVHAALFCACVALAVPGVPSSAGTNCSVAGTSFSWQNPQYRTWSGLFSGSPMPDVVQDRRSPTTRTIERWDGATGHRRWRLPIPFDGVLSLTTSARGDQLRVTADAAPCGAMLVASVDPVTGRVHARTRLGSIATTDLPDINIYSPPVGDFNGDGDVDAAMVRTAQNRLTPVPYRCYPQPNGTCSVPPAFPWHARVDVIDGRTGRILLGRDLGRYRAAMPTAMWVRRGDRDALAVMTPTSLTSGELSLFTAHGQAWRTTVPVGSSDAMLIPVTGGLAVIGESASEASQVPLLSTVSVVDTATGRLRWSQRYAGQVDVQTAGDGNLLVTDLTTATATKLAARTGATLWRRGPEGTYRLWPIVLGDVDGRGQPDVAFVKVGYVVAAGEDGRTLLDLGSDDVPYPLGDVTGDGDADLAVVTGSDSATPTVRLLRGGSLSTVWIRKVAFGDHGSILEMTGRDGTVLLHAIGGPTVALHASTGRRLWRVPAPA